MLDQVHQDALAALVGPGGLISEATVRLLTPELTQAAAFELVKATGRGDTARALGLSLRTVQRDWLKARAWLYRELGGPC